MAIAFGSIAWRSGDSGGFALLAADTVVLVGNTSIRARCVGRRLPGVLLLHGARSSGAVWDRVLNGWTGAQRLCAFDRPGHGRSGPVPSSRDWPAVSAEIHAIRTALGISGEWVVAGHSLGGLYARALAVGRDPPAALVLVDPAHEDIRPRLRGLIPDSTWVVWSAELTHNGDGIDEVELGEWLRNRILSPAPALVVSASRRRFPAGWDSARASAVARDVHSRLASTSGGRLITAERSGHDIPTDEPELVRRTITDALGLLGSPPARTPRLQ